MNEAIVKTQIKEFINSLTPFELRALILKQGEGLSQKNIAKVLEKSIKTIARTETRTIEKLHKYVDSELYV